VSGSAVSLKVPLARTFFILLAFFLAVNGLWFNAPRAAADAGAPDLVVQNITLSPPSPVVDTSITITVTVKNQGDTSAGQFSVACEMDNAPLDAKIVNSLGAGITSALTFTWTAQPGAHVVKATADSGNTVTENDETNNSKTFSFSTLAPDLTVPSITWTPVSPSRGDLATFSVVTKNQGTCKSNATVVMLYIDGALKETRDLNEINPGSAVTSTFTWTVTDGQHNIKAVVDGTGKNTESDETNNERSVTFSANPPDLTISSITYTPSAPARGATVTFSVNVTNVGNGRSEACFLGYYVDDLYIDAIPVAALDKGASRVYTYSYALSTFVDTHSTKAVIDYYSAVPESNETNNELKVLISSVTPDLIIKGITWAPLNAGIGDNITFTATIRNQGAGNSAAAALTYHIGAAYQGSVSVPPLEKQTETKVSFSSKADSFQIIVDMSVDPNNIVPESNEANNTLSATVPVLEPDLAVTGITCAPDNPAIGDTVVFTTTITNRGGGEASGYSVGFYIDNNLIQSQRIYVLPKNTSANLTCQWQTQGGKHIFKAVADCTNQLKETDKTNNERSIVIAPYMSDLNISSVTWSPSDISAGTDVTFVIGLVNVGTLTAGNSRLAYAVDGADAGYTDIGSVNPGDTVLGQFTWSAKSGAHTFTFTVDINNQVPEIDEANNIRIVALPPPDLIIQNISYSSTDISNGDTVAVTAAINNQGESTSQNSTADLYVDGVLYSTLPLPGIGAGKTIQETFPWVAAAGPHTIKVQVDPDNYVIESDETNNQLQADFSTMTPDLLVQGLSWQTNDSLTSNEVDFTITLKNNGTGAAEASKVKYSFDNTPSITVDVPAIPASGTTNITFVSILSAGAHKAAVTADVDNRVVELNESNNYREFTFSTIAPDLLIRTITWAPLDAGVGSNITISAKVENQGTAKALNLRIALNIDGVETAGVDVAEIDAGSSATINFPWVTKEGEHQITVVADSAQVITESDEQNNAKTRSLTFEKLAPPEKKPATTLAGIAPSDKGFMNKYWWVLLLIAGLLGIGAVASFLRSLRKKY
jgi:uncharacterized repeat protein (TIGR01451 family)